jgi:hypothetical protein
VGHPTLFLLGLLLATAPSETPARNLLTNGGFASGLSAWKASPDDPNSESGAMSWSRRDAGGSKTSGSLELVTSATADRNSFRVGQCVRLDARAENLVFGGRIRVASDQKPRGLASLEIERFQTTDCSGKSAPYDGLGGITNADFWSGRRELVATAQARSVRLVASVTKYYEWSGDDEIGEADDDIPFRAAFDDIYVTIVENGSPAVRPPLPADSSRFTPSSARPKKARWGPHLVDAPTLSLAVLGPDLRPHAAGVVPECSSLDSLQLELTLKNPYDEEDPRAYPLQSVSLAGEGDLGPRPSVEIGLFRGGDPQRKPVPVACNDGPPIGVTIIGERGERAAAVRELYDCVRSTASEEIRKGMAERMTDDEILAWSFTRWAVANPAGEYEIVARYHALEGGFWHEPVLSNPVKVKIVRKEPCPK